MSTSDRGHELIQKYPETLAAEQRPRTLAILPQPKGGNRSLWRVNSASAVNAIDGEWPPGLESPSCLIRTYATARYALAGQ